MEIIRPGERIQVMVHVNAGQSVLEDGAHVPAETSGGWRATRAAW